MTLRHPKSFASRLVLDAWKARLSPQRTVIRQDLGKSDVQPHALVTASPAEPLDSFPVRVETERMELRALTGIRGLAATWVLLFHVVPMTAQSIPSIRWLSRFSVSGDLGVDLFFILSGFVLSYSYSPTRIFGESARQSDRIRCYLHFLSVRLARIYPIQILVLLALAVAVAASHYLHINLNQSGTFGWDFVRNILLIQGWDLSTHLSWDGPAWSVSCEWAAYIAFPFILLVAARIRRRSIAFVGMASALAAEYIFFGFAGSAQPQLTYIYPLVRIAGEFIAGCFLFRIYNAQPTHHNAQKFLWLLGPLSLLGAAVGGALLAANGLSTIWVTPLFVLVIVGTWNDDSPWGRRLASPRLVHYGEASYALYMIHYPALLALRKFWVIPSSTFLRLVIVILGCGVIIVLALLVHAWIEVPARRRLRYLSRRLLPADAHARLTQEQTPPANGLNWWRAGTVNTLRNDSSWVLVGNVITGISNYGFTLLLIWILPGRQFAQVASVAALLLVAGTAAQAAIPWLVAREVVNRRADDPVRRHTIGFSLLMALVLGLGFSLLILVVASRYAGIGIEIAIIVAIPSIFVAQVGAGYLQGARRFQLFAVLMTVEAIVRLGFGGALAALGFGPTGAASGWALGALAGAAIALWLVRNELAWSRHPSRAMWTQVWGLGGIQIAVALLSTLDVIMESGLHGVSRPFAGYQSMLVFSRIPLFISGALSSVMYPRLVKYSSDDVETVASATRLFLLVSGISFVLVSTLPRSLLTLILPMSYTRSSDLLLPLAIAGIACGQINFSTTLLQARSEFRVALRVMGIAVPAAALLLGFASDSLHLLAWTAAGVNLVIGAVLIIVTNLQYRGSHLIRLTLVGSSSLAAGSFLFSILRDHPTAWLFAGVVLCTAGATAPIMYRRWASPIKRVNPKMEANVDTINLESTPKT